MDLSSRNFDIAFRGFQTLYNDAFEGAETHAMDVAMKVTSTARDETYGWLGQFPQLREWIGARVVHKLRRILSRSGTWISKARFPCPVTTSRMIAWASMPRCSQNWAA